MSDVGTIAAEMNSGSSVEAMRVASALLTIAKAAAEMTVDQRAELERACRVHGVTMPRLRSATPNETVHFLRGGMAICGRMGALRPEAWPPGNKWTAEASRITCEGCQHRFQSLRSTLR